MKKKLKRTLATIIFVSLTQLSYAITDNQGKISINDKNYSIVLPTDIKWIEGPSTLPKGAKMAILEGNPAREGAFTIRLKFPAGYKIAPHTHPGTEHVTIISGTFYLGISDKFDKKQAKSLPVGSFAYMGPGTTHFAFTHEETIIQLHGMGPWNIHYLNHEDNKK